MSDAENTTAAELAAQINGTQDEQASPADNVDITPSNAEETREERLLAGKYKSVDELESSYLELQRNYTASRQAQRVAPVQQPAAPSVFDDDTEAGIARIVDSRVERTLEVKRAEEFARKHADDLKDPLLRGAVLVEIQDANARGEIIDQEVALANAKRALDSRLAPKVDEAKKTSFDEGKNVARGKELAGAIGGTSTKAPEVDPESLSADEYAAYYGLK